MMLEQHQCCWLYLHLWYSLFENPACSSQLEPFAAAAHGWKPGLHCCFCFACQKSHAVAMWLPRHCALA